MVYVAAVFTTAIGYSANYDFNSNLTIPDGNPNGVSDIRSISQSFSISSVSVTLNISGVANDGYNGDLYAYLRHGSGFSVLLNRPGKTDSDSFGYADNGFRIKLQDGAANGDIHTYQLTLNPAAGSPLEGLWQPDGRNVDPSIVTDLSSRSAMLSAFQNMNAHGNWTLFIADMESGGKSHLDSWGLEFGAVPEPAETAAFTAGSLLAFAIWKRNRNRIAKQS